MSLYDQNQDGILDCLMIVNLAGFLEGGYNRVSYAGAYQADQHKNTLSSKYIYFHMGFVYDSSDVECDSSVLVHEFAHILGIQDYYDNNAQIACIGSYDMQSESKGDWNAYSKYYVGWITPMELNDDLFVDGVYTTTIRSFGKTGDAIAIRTDRNYGVYGEYLLLELFDRGSGVNTNYTDFYLEDTVGIQILHVNSYYYLAKNPTSTQTERVMKYGNGSFYPSEHMLTMIQAGKQNTFEKEGERHETLDEDFFKAGDVFDPSEYLEFFKADGGMINGYTLDMTITVDSISYDAENEVYVATVTFRKK